MLHDAVLEIAEQIDADALQTRDTAMRTCLMGYARQLRSVVKAATPEVRASGLMTNLGSLASNANDLAIVEAALKESVASEKRKVDAVESNADSMVELDDGSGVLTYVPIDPKMPTGAFTKIDGRAYRLDPDRVLRFDSKATERILQ